MDGKERKDHKLQKRVTKAVYDQVQELGVDLQEIVDYYITHNTNPTLKLKNRQKELLKNIEEWKDNIAKAEEELKEVNSKLGVPIDENIATFDVISTADKIKDACYSSNGHKCDELTLANYLTSPKSKSIIMYGFTQFAINGEEKRLKFIENVLKYLKCDDKKVFEHLKSLCFK